MRNTAETGKSNFFTNRGFQLFQTVRKLSFAKLFLISFLLFFLFDATQCFAQQGFILIPRIQYGGGGDWYTDPTSIPNLLKAASDRLKLITRPEHKVIKISDPDLFSYPMVYLTGHGNVKFDDQEINRLRTWLDNGGFLWIDDCYGIERSIKRELKKVFPDRELVLLPVEHPIFKSVYDFPKGIPKIHEHDGKAPGAYAIFNKGRMCVLYTYETDIGCGLEDEGIHPADSKEIRESALRMALNILVFAMNQ
ncbi:MAG: DUF4159 domain-containing protein [Candidatus Riflebacteria bacterium]|nr:DUF4159 domain-containing protein [Candidatus Riflebacteria bacterium]